MKTIQKLLFLALMYQLLPSWLVAQAGIPVKSSTPDKPFIFSAIPEKFECSTNSLRQLFNADQQDTVSIPLPGGKSFKGILRAKVEQEPGVLSVNIFSSNFPGTLFNISLITAADKSERMTGRFLNLRSGDAMTLELENNRYIIRKDFHKFVMAECPLPGDIDYSSAPIN